VIAIYFCFVFLDLFQHDEFLVDNEWVLFLGRFSCYTPLGFVDWGVDFWVSNTASDSGFACLAIPD
jgi:hypothetical protein